MLSRRGPRAVFNSGQAPAAARESHATPGTTTEGQINRLDRNVLGDRPRAFGHQCSEDVLAPRTRGRKGSAFAPKSRSQRQLLQSTTFHD
jgi:hypothetical protein